MTDVERIEADEWMRIYHSEYLKQNKHIPFIYRDTLKSLIEKLESITHITAENKVEKISKVFANQERAVAALNKGETLKLPIISVSQTTSSYDKERARPNVKLLYSTLRNKSQNRSYRVIYAAPHAVKIEYTLHIWTKYMSDMDQILEQIRIMFNPSITVSTGDKKIDFLCFIGEESDLSTREAKSQEDREIKKSIEITVDGYIPSPRFLITSTGRIELIGTDFDIEQYNS